MHVSDSHRLRSNTVRRLSGALLLMLASGNAGAVDLLDVFRLALSSDPTYQAAGAANRAAQEARPQARAQLLPQLNIGANVSQNYVDVRETESITTRPGSTSFTTQEYSLNLTQPVYRRELWVQFDQADSRIAQADAQYAFARQDLMLRVAERYFDVLRAEDELSFARAEMEAFQQQLRQSRQRFEVGLIAITDVEEAQAGFDLARAQVIAAENQLDVAREALREVTGEYHRNLNGMAEGIRLAAPQPDNIDRWTQTALAQNRNLAAARFAAEVSRDEIRRAEAGHWPSLDIVGSYSRDDSSGGISGASEIDRGVLGLQLSIPVFEGGLTVSRTRESRHRYDQAVDEVEAQRRSVHRQTREAYLGVISGISRVQALDQAVRSTESALEAIEAGFQVGTRTSVDVLNAQRDVFRAKRDLAGARYNYIVDTLTLKQAAGTLSEEDLGQINAWLR